MKNCLVEYLTSKCKVCGFWKDGTTNEGIGCASPFPISHCEAFSKENEFQKGKNKECEHQLA